MKISELRIGNLVNLICNGHEDEPDLVVWNVQDYEFYENRINDVKLIQITEEWLLKLGFEKNEGWDNMIYFNKNNIHIYKCNNSDKEWFEYECEILIKSVHQLQNLYFALTNEELILK